MGTAGRGVGEGLTGFHWVLKWDNNNIYCLTWQTEQGCALRIYHDGSKWNVTRKSIVLIFDMVDAESILCPEVLPG